MNPKFIALALITMIASTSLIAKTETQSGFFTFKNETDKNITIKVGDFFPTEYTIDAHSSNRIFVSTDNQNITLSRVEKNNH
jgi:hypothetical protein